MINLPEETLAQLRTIGRRFDPETIQEVYQLLAPLHRALGHSAERVTRDLAYGPDPRHLLDVHAPAAAQTAPVLLYVHGGGFVSGDRASLSVNLV